MFKELLAEKKKIVMNARSVYPRLFDEFNLTEIDYYNAEDVDLFYKSNVLIPYNQLLSKTHELHNWMDSLLTEIEYLHGMCYDEANDMTLNCLQDFLDTDIDSVQFSTPLVKEFILVYKEIVEPIVPFWKIPKFKPLYIKPAGDCTTYFEYIRLQFGDKIGGVELVNTGYVLYERYIKTIHKLGLTPYNSLNYTSLPDRFESLKQHLILDHLISNNITSGVWISDNTVNDDGTVEMCVYKF